VLWGGERGYIAAIAATLLAASSAIAQVTVRKVRITGSTIYGTNDLLPPCQALLGKKVTGQAVYDLARAITPKYGNDGFGLSCAVVPPQ
jgi:hemolysin activation/secretion protein